MKNILPLIGAAVLSFFLASCSGIYVEESDDFSPIFVAVGAPGKYEGGENSALVIASEDGRKWRKLLHTQDKVQTLYEVIHAEGAYTVIGRTSILRSENGEIWRAYSYPQGMRGVVHGGIAYGSGVYVAAGNNDTIIYSYDGMDWRMFEHRTDSNVQRKDIEYYCVHYSNNSFYLGGNYERITRLSVRGGFLEFDFSTNYSQKESSIIHSVVSIPSGFVALGNDEIYYSFDSYNFEMSGLNFNIISASYGGGTLVAFERYGSIYYSKKPLSWEQIKAKDISEETLMEFSSCAYSHGTFLGVGAADSLNRAGYVMISSNASNWEAVSLFDSGIFEGAVLRGCARVR